MYGPQPFDTMERLRKVPGANILKSLIAATVKAEETAAESREEQGTILALPTLSELTLPIPTDEE